MKKTINLYRAWLGLSPDGEDIMCHYDTPDKAGGPYEIVTVELPKGYDVGTNVKGQTFIKTPHAGCHVLYEILRTRSDDTPILKFHGLDGIDHYDILNVIDIKEVFDEDGHPIEKEKLEMKDRISKINKAAQEDFSRAQGMLDMLNEICGTTFGWNKKRVAIVNPSDRSLKDAWVNL